MKKQYTMTMKAAAQKLGVSVDTIRRAVRTGKIKALRNPLFPSRIGGVYRSDVERYARKIGE